MRRKATSAATGAVGEAIACRFLESRGYRVIDRNVFCRAGELDLVAWQGDTLVFVEVKTRTSEGLRATVESVHPGKQRRLLRAAEAYLARAGLCPRETRFDVVIVTGVGEETSCTLIIGAFEDRH
ncbi:hypothetical protein HRbin30_01740 [bacterium HR30]|nr:hypothetical protein HRbin30_01740 [bacterium HR30]